MQQEYLCAKAVRDAARETQKQKDETESSMAYETRCDFLQMREDCAPSAGQT